MTRFALALALPLLAAAPAPPPADVHPPAPQPPLAGAFQLAVLPYVTGAYGAEWVILDTRTGELQRWREGVDGWEVVTLPADRSMRAPRRERIPVPRF